MGLRKTEATGLVGWIDQRLSIMDAWNNHLAQYWAPKKLQRLVLLWVTSSPRFSQPNPHGYLANDEL
jgi:hypothetical protein